MAFIDELRKMTEIAYSLGKKQPKSVLEYEKNINEVITRVAGSGLFSYHYSGIPQDIVLEVARHYDNQGFFTSVRKDRFSENEWTLYLNWSYQEGQQ